MSGAQPQNQSSQHAGYSQHLLVGDSGEGLRRPPSSSSLLFLPFLFSSSLSLSLSLSPFRPLSLRGVSPLSLLRQCGNSSLICGTSRGSVEVEGQRITATHLAARHRARRTAGCSDCGDGTRERRTPGTTPSYVMKRREMDPGAFPFLSFLFLFFCRSPRLPLTLSSSALLALLLLPICRASQPTPTAACSDP